MSLLNGTETTFVCSSLSLSAHSRRRSSDHDEIRSSVDYSLEYVLKNSKEKISIENVQLPMIFLVGDVFDESEDTIGFGKRIQGAIESAGWEKCGDTLSKLRLAHGCWSLVVLNPANRFQYMLRDVLGRGSLLVSLKTDSDKDCVQLSTHPPYPKLVPTIFAKPRAITGTRPLYADHTYDIGGITEILEFSELERRKGLWRDVPPRMMTKIAFLGENANVEIENMPLYGTGEFGDMAMSIFPARKVFSGTSLLETFLKTLKRAIERRFMLNKLRYFVSFSGGVDCTLLALALREIVRPDAVIYLVNIEFSLDEISSDREQAVSTFEEICEIAKGEAEMKLVNLDISESVFLSHKSDILRHLYPNCTVMDLNIGSTIYFLSRSSGKIVKSSKNKELNSKSIEISSEGGDVCVFKPDIPMVNGLGPDELMGRFEAVGKGDFVLKLPFIGGYKRHRRIIKECGAEGTGDLIKQELLNLWKKNLGYFHRCSALPVYYPYLDENVLKFVNGLDYSQIISENGYENGPGDKLLVRRCLREYYGLENSFKHGKRAIQV